MLQSMRSQIDMTEQLNNNNLVFYFLYHFFPNRSFQNCIDYGIIELNRNK